MQYEKTPETAELATVEQLVQQVTRLEQSHARQRKWLVGCLLLLIAVAVIGGAVRVKGGAFEVWPDAATADPKSSHQVKLIGTDGAGAQRSMTLQNKSIDGTDYRLDFSAGTTELLTLKSDGKFGIGTVSPAAELELVGSAGINAPLVKFGTAGATDSNSLRIGNGASSLSFFISGTADTFIPGTALADGGLKVAASKKIFLGDVDKSRMVLDSDGKVGIGMTTPANILTIVQTSATDPIADAWTIYSSRRWKKNIRQLEGALAKVQQLRGVSFDWRKGGTHDIGLIAEEVGRVVPQVVAYESNGVDARSVDYARLVALLIESTKQQQEQIEALRAELNKRELEVLKAQNSELKTTLATQARLSKIERILAGAGAAGYSGRKGSK